MAHRTAASPPSPRPYRRLRTEGLLKQVLAAHHLLTTRAPRLGRKVAWITSGAPVELLASMGVISHYPENYGALCGARKVGADLCQVAEDRGYPADLCSYARNDLGSMFAPDRAPLGGLPRPDMLIACNNICGTVTKWWEHLAHHLGVPLFMLDAPFLGDDPREHLLRYVADQVGDLVTFLEQHTGRRYHEARFRRLAERSVRTVTLWNACLDLCTARPAPMNAADRFLAMAPVVTMRGSRAALLYYSRLKDEVTRRVAEGKGALRTERRRLLWDNIAIWFDIFGFFNRFADAGVSFPADTYTSIWRAAPFDRMELGAGVARAYADMYLNRGMETRLRIMSRMIERFELDGFVLHSNRSCKPYSLGQLDIKEELTRRTGRPGILIEADMVDSRLYDKERVSAQVAAFLEVLA